MGVTLAKTGPTALEAARHNLRWAKAKRKPWETIRHLEANVARAKGVRYYPGKVNQGDRHWYVFDLLATGGPGPTVWVSHQTKRAAQAIADERNGLDG